MYCPNCGTEIEVQELDSATGNFVHNGLEALCCECMTHLQIDATGEGGIKVLKISALCRNDLTLTNLTLIDGAWSSKPPADAVTFQGYDSTIPITEPTVYGGNGEVLYPK